MKSVNKTEALGILFSIAIMAVALAVVRFKSEFAQMGAVAESENASGVVVVDDGADKQSQSLTKAIFNASSNARLDDLVVDDLVVGTGEAVEPGDVVSVHYIGRLQNGQEFDNSYDRGMPFEFEVGAGRVIKGWDEGLVGMKVGGQRVLIIPPELGYGKAGAGPIPGNAVLVFAIELLEIK